MGDQYEIDRDGTGLTNQERRVYDLMAFDKLNGAQVAEVLGISRQRVHQIRQSLILKGMLTK